MGYFILLIYRPVYCYIRSITVSNQEVLKEISIYIYVYPLGTHTQNIHSKLLEGIKYLNLVKSPSTLPPKWINCA